MAGLTERTTAGTDGLLALSAGLGAGYLQWVARQSYARTIWQVALTAFGLAAALGTLTHGAALGSTLQVALWQALYLLLGIAMGMFVVGSVADWKGPSAARRVLPVMLGLVGLFYVVTLLAHGKFLVFVIFQAVALLFALGVYGSLAVRRHPGAAGIALALGITLFAGCLQAWEGASAKFIWEFDHNGLYHLAQLAGLAVLLPSLRRSLDAETSSVRKIGAQR